MSRTNLAASVAVIGALALVRLAAQSGTATPGQPTQARVWIENRAPTESIPVAVQSIAMPLHVQVDGVPHVAFDAATALPVRAQQQRWEYRTMLVPTSTDPAAALNAAGAGGWEVAGVTPTGSGQALIVLKRPTA